MSNTRDEDLRLGCGLFALMTLYGTAAFTFGVAVAVIVVVMLS